LKNNCLHQRNLNFSNAFWTLKMPPKKRVRMKVSSQPPSNPKAATLESDNDDQHLQEPSVKVKSTQRFVSPSLLTTIISKLQALDECSRQFSRKGTPPSRPYGKPVLPKAAGAKRQSASEKEVIISLLLRMKQHVLMLHTRCIEIGPNANE
jgi:hypothetical protein